MHKLPSEHFLQKSIGSVLIQVSFGTHVVALHFDDNTSITIESTITSPELEQSAEELESYKAVASILVGLLSTRVVAITCLNDGTLDLAFSNGQKLTIHRQSGGYESYQIQRGSVDFVI